LLSSYGLYSIVIYLFPYYYIILFAIYPLFYLYFRKFAFGKMHITFSNSYKHLILTCIASLLILAFYLPLTYDEKIEFILNEFINPSTSDIRYNYFQLSVYIIYYTQFLVYLYLILRLSKNLQVYDNQEKLKINIPIKTWVKLFITGSVIFEVSFIFVTFSFSKELYQAIEQLISFAYIIFIGLLGINQSKLLIQARLYQAITKTNKKESDNNYNSIVSDDEKREIRRLIELIIKEKKLYLDPNLKLEFLAKKIHIPTKKLSQTINDIYKKNFSNFINDYRIQEAISILESGVKASIDEICRNVGYNSRSTFNRAFKASTDLTPREYVIKHKISNDL